MSHPPRAPPSATSAHPAVHLQIAGPAPARCTSYPDDPPDTSYPPDAAGTAPDAPDRFRKNQTPRPRASPAHRTTACRFHVNKDGASLLPVAATHRTPSKCRCPSETVSPPSAPASLCPSTQPQTTAPRHFAENKPPCRSPREFPPPLLPAHAPSRRDSTALPQ